MVRVEGSNRNINRLNKTWHCAGTEDFERPRLLLPRRVSHILPPPDTIVPYPREAGFGDTVLIRDFTFDNSLITTFVERWRPKTHTFHLPWGEATITLQDVAYHLELRAHGDPVRGASVTSTGAGSVEEGFVLDEACMAVRPCPPDGTDGRPKDPPTVVPGIVLGLGCVGLDVPVTMPTMLGNTPRHHRHRWLYSALDVLDIPKIFFQWIAVAEQNQHEMKFVEEEEWGTCMSVVPFVCFNIVQFHHVDRVKRQFNGEQPVPGAPVECIEPPLSTSLTSADSSITCSAMILP
ncbi:uncharacterized protein DS421_13g425310 [Arachis hypogaea]|nr:uncharacterized protein DS421_13g425310 [Arachis hypogaea]